MGISESRGSFNEHGNHSEGLLGIEVEVEEWKGKVSNDANLNKEPPFSPKLNNN